MDLSPRAAVRLLLPRLPLILKTALFNALSLSPNSSKQNLTTEVAVAFLRSILRIRRPVLVLQRVSTRDPGIQGPILVSKVTIPAPNDESGPRDAVCSAIKELGDGSETYTLPDYAAVEAEWTSYGRGISSAEPRPDRSEQDHYQRLMEHTSSPVTILYFHGGAYFLMDPATVREPISRLTKITGGRAFAVRYRLAPQAPFPAQLLDALIAYLSLLSPPPGSFHEPVPAQNIVLAGESAGANLAIALLQLLLTLQRMGQGRIRFHGVDVPIQLPAGVAGNSPWTDITRSQPSINNNAHFDYLDPPSATGISRAEPIPDAAWPASPPRAEIFCNASMMVHPLASPLAAPPELWKGMPPAFMCLGNEGLEDEITVLARRMHQGGGVVDFVGYEGMPHCFAMIFPTSPAGRDCFVRWAKFCSGLVQGSGPTSSRAVWAEALSKPLRFKEVPMHRLTKLADHEVNDAMNRMQKHAMDREKEALEKWSEQQSKAKL
ncbi:uncharacterized protein Z518_06654 [Rhinocladiella mackenziei CBS 650.93]|uniref:Alpha/beta hydrolase fold-3 domain-containing protein n=1 Tax=Rhinocladiella mackenziei CBS 650.93 TaxID=1442369 RepID=A0A0D2IB98_9EURO|nr:uncharacterized protein Z518_06654 [Rhinocladiella mackenziei CBS 650.93]KIX03104.1 hypothetical protein Z518_06654 [Rhinocladiella mackenziei CBS 650.93]